MNWKSLFNSKAEEFYCGVIEKEDSSNVTNLVGFSIWNKECSACHSLTKEVIVGPGLYNSIGLHSKTFIKKILTGKDKLSKDPYYKKLSDNFGKVSYHLNYVSNYSDKEIDSLLNFMETSSKIIVIQ